jgi:hypothetical protein
VNCLVEDVDLLRKFNGQIQRSKSKVIRYHKSCSGSM